MPLIVVGGSQRGVGASTVAAGISVAPPAGADLGRLAAYGRLLVVATVGGGPGLLLNHQRRTGPHAIEEDRLLAAPTVGELTTAAHARVLARSAEGDTAVC